MTEIDDELKFLGVPLIMDVGCPACGDIVLAPMKAESIVKCAKCKRDILRFGPSPNFKIEPIKETA